MCSFAKRRTQRKPSWTWTIVGSTPRPSTQSSPPLPTSGKPAAASMRWGETLKNACRFRKKRTTTILSALLLLNIFSEWFIILIAKINVVCSARMRALLSLFMSQCFSIGSRVVCSASDSTKVCLGGVIKIRCSSGGHACCSDCVTNFSFMARLH